MSTVKTDWILPLAVGLALVFGGTGICNAQILIDDFEDGDDVGWTHADGTINETWGPATYDASDGSYHFLGGGPVPGDLAGSFGSGWDRSSDEFFSDGFLRARVRANNSTTLVALVMRYYSQDDDWGLYNFLANPVDGNFWYEKWNNGQYIGGDRFYADEHFEPGQDWIVEAGAVGGRLSMKVWRADQAEPSAPQWNGTDSSPLAPGLFGLQAMHWRFDPTRPGVVDATFDDVYFTPALRADFNWNGNVDGDDCDVWQSSFASGTGALHSDGDADFDGDVDGGDFLIWQREYGTTTGSSSLTAGVPEPTSVVLFLTFNVVGLLRRRIRLR